MSQQPYVPPADDGGGQGSFTQPADVLAQPNAQDPEDRGSVFSFANGAKDQARLRGPFVLLPGRSQRWISFAAVWKAQTLILAMVFVFSAMTLLGHTLGH